MARRYRMVQMGYRNNKPLWRGTGFNPDPGGVTWMDGGCGWVPRIFTWAWWLKLVSDADRG